MAGAALGLAWAWAGPTEVRPAGPREAPDAGAAAPSLSPLARAVLKRRMERHGKDLTLLVQSVVLLRRSVVAELATAIANEPRLVKPGPDAIDELNSQLPAKFFTLQDQLRARAKDLANAARGGDDDALGASFAATTQTCLACHSAFLGQ